MPIRLMTLEGTDQVFASVSFDLTGAYVEALTLEGTGRIDAFGNHMDNAITGNTAANTLKGGAGDDTIDGHGGNDRIFGGEGNDTLIGGGGGGVFYFDTALSASLNVDSIVDFSVTENSIRLDRTIFAGISANGTLASSAFYAGSAAHDASDRILYNSSTGALLYDADGTGARKAV